MRAVGQPAFEFWAWVGVSLLLLLLVPPQILNDVPFWKGTPTAVGQGMLTATAFLGISLFVSSASRRTQGALPLACVAVGGLWYGAAYALLSARPNLVHGWSDFLVAAGLGCLLVPAPYIGSARLRRFGLGSMTLLLVGTVFMGSRHAITGAPQRSSIVSALEPLSVTVHRSVIAGERGKGGAVEPYGPGFLLVTSGGQFFELSLDGRSLRSKRLPMSLPDEPANASPQRADRVYVSASTRRVTDLLLDASSSPPQVYVAYQRWDVARRCVAVHVSRAPLAVNAETSSASAWTPVFTSSPCLQGFTGFDWVESGGKLARLGDQLLVTVGEFGLSEGRLDGAQSPATAYGKVWAVDAEGHAQIYTMGHRNPQGLFVDDRGAVWLTEQGPQGGDELNLLRPGQNYGYPLATYGTTYGSYVWALAPGGQDHGDFEEPVHAFPPWRAVTSLIRVQSHRFPSWRRDLLIASLNAASLFRVRLRDDRAVYVEQIPLGFRIRDLAEGADGRLLLWNDTGTVIVIDREHGDPDGGAVFASCRQCHDPTRSETLSLRGVMNRPVASQPGYTYTDALRQLGGNWTEDRLDAFLADPAVYAPGSAMAAGRVPDEKARRALLRFLRTYR